MNNNSNPTELGHSPDALAQRQAELLALLRQAAPEVLSDNQLNLEKLKELLGQERIAPAEHYELNWAGLAKPPPAAKYKKPPVTPCAQTPTTRPAPNTC